MDYKMLFLFFGGLYCYGVWKENFDIPDKIMTIINIAIALQLFYAEYYCMTQQNTYRAITTLIFILLGVIINMSFKNDNMRKQREYSRLQYAKKERGSSIWQK